MGHPAIPLPPAAAGPKHVPRTTAVLSSRALPAVVATTLALLLILADFATWIELNVAMVYGVPLVFAAASRRPRMLWSLALCLVAATFVVYAVQMPLAQMATAAEGRAVPAELANAYLVDRALAALAVLLTAAILQGWLLSLQAIAARDLALEENNLQLRRANEELLRHKEEITRRNAELDLRRRAAEEASRRKTQMLAAISHDIRTPLHAISLIAEILRRTADAPEARTRLPAFAQRLQSHALTVAELLSEVIDQASLEAGRVELHRSRFELGAFLRDQALRLAPLAEDKGLALRAEPSAEPLFLCTDKVKLERIMGNLVGNAVKFTSAGTVTLRGELAGDGVRLAVVDTGCGIRAENLERIFGDFCQEDPSVQSGSGWGLGLAICRRLTLLLGGALQVDSTPGRGSTFTVVLPPCCVESAPQGLSADAQP